MRLTTMGEAIPSFDSTLADRLLLADRIAVITIGRKSGENCPGEWDVVHGRSGTAMLRRCCGGEAEEKGGGDDDDGGIAANGDGEGDGGVG